MKLDKKNINFFIDLYKLMNNSEFRNFYNKYFTVWTNIDTMIMYFKLYEIIELNFFKKFNRSIKKNEILFLLNNIIKNNLLRKIVIDNYILFKNSEQKYLTTNNTQYIEYIE
tara:strand:+ start:112 stop:447 length:336 start_codon:yes stop_codon:yes gene_type:complete